MADPVSQHRAHGPSSVACAVITCSDSRTEASDETGRLIREELGAAGHRVEYYTVVRDDADAIRAAVQRALGMAKVVITNGGTGLAARDVTLEALEPLWKKRLDGFGEIFRALSYKQVGTAAMMSRAAAGVVEGGFVACLPGSPAAARLALEEVLLPELEHIAGLLEWRGGRVGGPGGHGEGPLSDHGKHEDHRRHP